MKSMHWALTAVLLAGAAPPFAGAQAPQPEKIRAEGCVEAGVEARCLIVKDLNTGKVYALLMKDPRPGMGDGIEFTGVPSQGVSYCMHGTPVQVTEWKRKDSLKCNRNKGRH